MIEKPTTSVNNLIGYERKAMLFLIRQFSKQFYHLFGADKAEETIIALIDKGKLKIGYNETTKFFTLLIYDDKIQNYKQC